MVYWGSGSIAPRILDLGPRWRWVVSFTPRHLYPQGKSPCYPLDRSLGGPHMMAKRESSFPAPTWNRTLVVQPVAYSLHYWLSYPERKKKMEEGFVLYSLPARFVRLWNYVLTAKGGAYFTVFSTFYWTLWDGCWYVRSGQAALKWNLSNTLWATKCSRTDVTNTRAAGSAFGTRCTTAVITLTHIPTIWSSSLSNSNNPTYSPSFKINVIFDNSCRILTIVLLDLSIVWCLK
jgi:hypothetical protein